MPESGTGRAASSAIAGTSSLDHLRAAGYTLTLRNLTTANDRALAFGSAASAPATFGALHGALQAPLVESRGVTISLDTGGGFRVSVSDTLGQSSLAAMTTGEHVYACLFAVDPAISGSVPDIVIDLGELF